MAGSFEVDVVARPSERALDVFVRDERGHYLSFDGHSPDFAALTSPVRRPAVTIGAGLGARIADALRAVATQLDAVAPQPPVPTR